MPTAELRAPVPGDHVVVRVRTSKGLAWVNAIVEGRSVPNVLDVVYVARDAVEVDVQGGRWTIARHARRVPHVIGASLSERERTPMRWAWPHEAQEEIKTEIEV